MVGHRHTSILIQTRLYTLHTQDAQRTVRSCFTFRLLFPFDELLGVDWLGVCHSVSHFSTIPMSLWWSRVLFLLSLLQTHLPLKSRLIPSLSCGTSLGQTVRPKRSGVLRWCRVVTTQTPPSTPHCVTAGHPAPAPGSPLEAVRAAIGTPDDQLARVRRKGRPLARL